MQHKRHTHNVKFTINDTPLATHCVTPTVAKVIALARGLKDGELITISRAASLAGIGSGSFHRLMMAMPEELKAKDPASPGRRWLIGNAKTIAAFKAQFV